MLRANLTYALRLMRRSPGFTIAAIITLALGIGANTAVFSIANTILLRPLPVAHPEELVEFLQKYPGEPRADNYLTWSSYLRFREARDVFSEVTGVSFDNAAPLKVEGGSTETVVRENVVGNYFEVLGITPTLGRLIEPGDVLADGSGDVMVLSWRYWNRRFLGDPGVLGRRVALNGTQRTIIGVGPRDYNGPRVGAFTDVWVPQERDPVSMIARLKPGVAIERAQAETDALYQYTIEERAAGNADPQVRQAAIELEPASAGFARIRDQYAKPLVLLACAVGLLVLLACANIGGMLVARSAARRQEIAVRAALGATRLQLLAQTLTESLLLAGFGTIAGIAVAYAATRAVVRILASGRAVDRIDLEVVPDANVLLFTIATTLVTGVLFGLAPAWQSQRTIRGARVSHGGRALIAAQVAISIVLITAAFIFARHLAHLRDFDLGFRSDHTLVLALDTQETGYTPDQLAQGYRDLLGRLEAIPGVRSASISGCTPIEGCGASRFIRADGFEEPPAARQPVSLNWVAPRYFDTLGIPRLAGRDFSAVERERVIIVNQAFAGRYFADRDPIGRHLSVLGGDGAAGPAYEIVGIVGDAKYAELRDAAPPTVYFDMFPTRVMVSEFIVRTDGNPLSVASAARDAIRDVLKTVPVARVTTLTDQVDAAIVPERLLATLSGYFGVVGAALAGVGLYGLLAYTVARRTREVGLRMALGATWGNTVWLVVREAMGTTGAGLAVGLLLVYAGNPLIQRLVEGVDAGVKAPSLAAAFILAIAILAAYVPARRAARVDPMVALRHD